MNPARFSSCATRPCKNQPERARRVADRRQSAFGALCALSLLTSVADAADEPRYQITPFGAYVTGGDFETDAGLELDADESNGWGLALSMEELPGRYYELLLMDSTTEIDAAVPFDMDVQYVQIGGTVSWPESEWVIPYMGITLGAARFSPDSSALDDVTRAAFSIGAGVRVPIAANIGFRLEWRTYLTLLGSDEDLFCTGAGDLTCNFRAESDTFMQHTAQAGISIGFGR